MKRSIDVKIIGIFLCFSIIGYLPAGYGQTDDLNKCISDLKSTDTNVRTLAIEKLGISQDPSSVEPLLAVLKDPDSNIRVTVAFSLSLSKDPRVVEALIAALKDKVSDVRNSAALSLGRIKNPRAYEPLVALLKDPDAHVRYSAAAALTPLIHVTGNLDNRTRKILDEVRKILMPIEPSNSNSSP